MEQPLTREEIANWEALKEVSDEDFRLYYWPIAKTMEFSACASGDRTPEAFNELREKLKETRIEPHFWRTDNDLMMLVSYITARIVSMPIPKI